MPDFYRVQIQSINGNCLSCRVTQLEGPELESSLSLVFGFLWDTVDVEGTWMRGPDGDERTMELLPEVAQSSPLGQELAGRDFGADQNWNLENAERFISCFGVTDRRVVRAGEDGKSTHYPRGAKVGQAIYNIAVTDPQWISHLKPGMEWESRVWDQGWALSFDPAWRTVDVMALARGVDASQDFNGLPVLADALQEAGCDSDELLNHLRDTTASHVRGCWALDLVLGKE